MQSIVCVDPRQARACAPEAAGAGTRDLRCFREART